MKSSQRCCSGHDFAVTDLAISMRIVRPQQLVTLSAALRAAMVGIARQATRALRYIRSHPLLVCRTIGVVVAVSILFVTSSYLELSSWVGKSTPERFDSITRACPSVADWYADTDEAHPFAHHVFRAANRFGLDQDLVFAVIAAESSCRHKARSNKGAQGLMQLMPATAKWLGVRDVRDPEQNIMGGARYLSMLLRQFDGDMDLALAAYNAGPYTVRRYGGIPPYRETKRYVAKVRHYRDQLKQLRAA